MGHVSKCVLTISVCSVIDTEEHLAVIHLTGYGGKEDTIIEITISAEISSEFIRPNFAIFLTAIPIAVSFSKGHFNGTGWNFIPSEFGKVVVHLPLHYSGDIYFRATSFNGNSTDEAFLNITIEPIANIPILSTNLSSPCYMSANSTIFINIYASLVDNDGSELLHVFIVSLPDSIIIPNLERNSNGVYVITNPITMVELRLVGAPQVNITITAESIEETNGDRAYNNVTKLIRSCPQGR